MSFTSSINKKVGARTRGRLKIVPQASGESSYVPYRTDSTGRAHSCTYRSAERKEEGAGQGAEKGPNSESQSRVTDFLDRPTYYRYLV
jgi:hypothetical protein